MAGGNYGGNSIPTTPILGSTLVTGKNTTYKDWACTTILGTAGSSVFLYEGQSITLDADTQVELLIYPPRLTSQTDCIFLCYECSCNSTMTGTTAPSSFYSGTTDEFIRPAIFQPTIIGGGGLNS